MGTLLLIETATVVCSVAIARQGNILSLRESHEQRSHAELITIFIQECLDEARLNFDQLDAVAVSRGPGSYTGLRIGVSTAKGICFAKDIPLIATDTLQAMAAGFAEQYTELLKPTDLLIPMIDARRMEVYTATFKPDNERIEETTARIIDENSYADLAENHRLWFFGDGADKCNPVLHRPEQMNIVNGFTPSAKPMAGLAQQAYEAKQFVDLAYFEPFYLKDFVAGIPKVKGLK